jgi:hypothetical protein
VKFFCCLIILLYSSILKDSDKKCATIFSSNIDTVIIKKMDKKVNYKSPYWSKYSSKCTKWELDSNKIVDIIKSRKKIDPSEFDYLYSVLPCYYEGYVFINGKKYYFYINSGSYLVLRRNGNETHYSIGNKIFLNYFITHP